METAKRNSDNSTKYPNPWTWLKSRTDSTLNQGEIPPPINSATAVTVPNKLTYGKKYSSSKSYYFFIKYYTPSDNDGSGSRNRILGLIKPIELEFTIFLAKTNSYSIFDDFSKFCSAFSVLYVHEKSSYLYAQKLA